MTAHRSDIRVRFYELDPYAHVNHSVYIQYFETARVELLDEVGFGLDLMRESDTAFVVIRIATRFLRSAGLSDALRVETGLVDAGRVRATWGQRIVRQPRSDAADTDPSDLSSDLGSAPGHEEIIATQVVEIATTNLAGKPRRLPEGIADAMQPFVLPVDWFGAAHPDPSMSAGNP